MAEVIGVASGVAGIATFAFQASIGLYGAITSYQSHQRRVIDLMEENAALTDVLRSLDRAIASGADVDFSALETPLKRCGKACQEFGDEIKKFSSTSGDSRTRLRDWARLKYMGEDIDGFRRLLAGYKATISIALADANLQQSSLTAERIEGYIQLIQTAKADFEDRLERIDETLEELLSRSVSSGPESAAKEAEDAEEIEQIREERLSTEKCLQICAGLSEHINQIRLAGRLSDRPGEESRQESTPERITNKGLNECEESLTRVATSLAHYERELFDRLGDKMGAVGSPWSRETAAEVARLRDEWESTCRSMEVLRKAGRRLEDTVSKIENRAKGNAIQVMVSTEGKPIHGINQGDGNWTRQVGGLMSDATVQNIMRSLVSITVASDRESIAKEEEKKKEKKKHARGRVGRMAKEGRDSSDSRSGDSTFEDLYGEGHTLECESPTGSIGSLQRDRE